MLNGHIPTALIIVQSMAWWMKRGPAKEVGRPLVKVSGMLAKFCHLIANSFVNIKLTEKIATIARIKVYCLIK